MVFCLIIEENNCDGTNVKESNYTSLLCYFFGKIWRNIKALKSDEILAVLA